MHLAARLSDGDLLQYSAGELSTSVSDKLGMLEKTGLLREGCRPSLHTGAVAAGSTLVASRGFKESLLKRNRNLLAVDMESAAFNHNRLDLGLFS